MDGISSLSFGDLFSKNMLQKQKISVPKQFLYFLFVSFSFNSKLGITPIVYDSKLKYGWRRETMFEFILHLVEDVAIKVSVYVAFS